MFLQIMAKQAAIGSKNVKLHNENADIERLASIGMAAATFAHEIRNPLTSLKTFVQLLPDKYDDEEFRTSFSRLISEEVEKINSMIEDLTGDCISRTEKIDLTELINDTIDYIERKCRIEGYNIDFRRPDTASVIIVDGDRNKLRRAFENIILNGCQAIKGSGSVEINIVPNGNYADIIVSDNGTGIKESDMARIFRPFYTTREGGMGFGLAITKKIINAHSGSIHIDSKPHRGTTVKISLPYCRGNPV